MDDDVKVKEQDIEAIEKEIAEKERSKEAKLKKEIEEKVKADIVKEKEMEEMKSKVAAYEEEKAKLAKEKEEYEKNLRLQAEQHEEEMKKLKAEQGSSKQIYSPTGNGPQKRKSYSDDELAEIEAESRRAWFEYSDPNRRR